LVADGIDAQLCEAILTLCAEDDPSRLPRDGALALSRRLLDEAPHRQGLISAFISERMFAYQSHEERLANAWLTRSIHRRRLPDALARATRRIEVARYAENMPTSELRDGYRGSIPGFLFGQGQQTQRASRAAEPNEDGYGRIFEAHFRILAEKRMAGIALALRVYRDDHPGDGFPESLDRLVPTYLLAVPTGPFRPGQSIGYLAGNQPRRPDGQPRPLVWYGGGDVPPLPSPTFAWTQNSAKPSGIDLQQFRDLTLWSVPWATTAPAAVQGYDR
jgi:hypothetical protein